MKIRLYKNVNLTKKDTIKFKARSQQNNYFNRPEIYHSEIEYSSGPIVNVIKMTEKNFYECQNITYARVGEFGGKDYFYFVNDVEFINEDTTYLYVELDYIQTYMFDMEIVDSIVKREHQDRFDRTGKRIFNLEDEPVEVAEFEYLEGELKPNFLPDYADRIYVAIMTRMPDAAEPEKRFQNFGMVSSNLETYFSFFSTHILEDLPYESRVFFSVEGKPETRQPMPTLRELNTLLATSKEKESMRIAILPYAALGSNGDIRISISEGPEFEIPYIDYEGSPPGTYSGYDITVPDTAYWSNTKAQFLRFSATSAGGVVYTGNYYMINGFNIVPTNIDLRFSDKNINLKHYINSGVFNESWRGLNMDSKIFTSSYGELKVKEGRENEQVFYFEEMMGREINFIYSIASHYEINQRLSLKDYRIPENILLTGSGNTMTKITSEYLNYLRDSKGSRTSAYIGSAVSIIAGVVATMASGGTLAPLALGGVATGITSLVSEGGKRADMRNKPLKTSDEPENLEYNMINNLIKYRVQIKRPTPKEIDKLNRFFYRYGYTANRVGVPLLEGREDFNYVQAEQLIIKGSIPANDKKTINNLFSDGLRFWHKSENFLDFTVDNKEDWIEEVWLNE